MKTIKEKAKKIKILAPAGDWESLRVAKQAGADYVYLGIEDLNMRSSGAKNFPLEDMSKIARFCKQRSIKAYITLNTIMYNSDLDKMREIIDEIKKYSLGGIIASDMAVIQYAKEKKVPVCISTQQSISNIEAVKFFSNYSNRIVLARELTLKQIKEICNQIEEEQIVGKDGKKLEVELFAHGALCVAVSGRCHMSLFCYDSSANRGKCTQICRRKYKVTDVETGQELVIDNDYVMSPKDLCTIGMLPEIIDVGVDVLKIEGRARTPEYVDTVVRTYKKAINAIIEDRYTKEFVEGLKTDLQKVFNRGFGTGMYLGRKMDEWTEHPGNQAKKERVYVGKVLHFFTEKKVALIRVLADVSITESQECIILGPKTGMLRFKAKNMIVNNKRVKKVLQGDDFTIELSKRVRKNDQVYILKEKNT